MKKHVLGIVFFVSIVGLSAVVYSLVSLYSIPSIEDPNAPILEYPKNCYPDHVGKKIKIVQAIATPSERSLVLDFARDKIKPSGRATLVFHAVSEQGARFIRSELVDITRNAGLAKYTFEWLKDVRDGDNLYISVRPTLSGKDDPSDLQFLEKDAMAILIAKK